MNTINHLLVGHLTQLSIPIIQKVLNYSKLNHHFYILLNNRKYEEKYIQVFNIFHFEDYTFIYITKSSLFSHLRVKLSEIAYPIPFLRSLLKPVNYLEDTMLYFVKKHNGDNLVLHMEINMFGVFFPLFIARKKIKYLWVCWGGVPKIYRKPFIYRFSYSALINEFLANAKGIVALATSDQKEITGIPCVKAAYFRPYLIDFFKSDYNHNKPHRVLVGNSLHYFDTYLALWNQLSKLAGFHITFMTQYGTCDKDTFNTFKNECKSNPSGNVLFWSEMMSIDDYREHFDNFSVYISRAERQAGLGAINTSIVYGLKLYLNGVNYENYMELGYKVHHVNELNHICSFEALCVPDGDEIQFNFNHYIKMHDVSKASEEWDNIYRTLLS